jgi:hypothetical protein
MPVFLLTPLILALVLLVCMEAGFRLRHKQSEPPSGLGVIEGAIFGLLGLLLAFAFSGADSRFEARRQLVVQETNAISSAWEHLDLLPPATQPEIRADFRSYVDARLSFYEDLRSNWSKIRADVARSNALQKKIWLESIEAAQQSPSPALMPMVISSIDSMISVTSTRGTGLQSQPPLPIFLPLFVLALVSSVIAGYGMGEPVKRPWLHMLVFVVALTITIYTVIDLEFPRYGVIRVDNYDRMIVNQRSSMN